MAIGILIGGAMTVEEIEKELGHAISIQTKEEELKWERIKFN